MQHRHIATAAIGTFLCVSGASAETATYTYDAKGRLVRVQKVNSTYVSVDTTITHDKADNRKKVKSNVTPR